LTRKIKALPMNDSGIEFNHHPVFRSLAGSALALFILAGCTAGGSEPAAGSAACRPNAKDFSLFLAGDSIIVEPWSDVNDPSFLKLVDEIRSADAAITNLETVVHEFKGYPQADSGGIHMASPPRIASELAWAGFDMVANANNHAFDYGSIGVLETLDNVRKAGLEIAGSGEDLQRAREPAYFHGARGTVALVATASTYVGYGRAGPSRPEVHGRPGVNPLHVTHRKSFHFPGHVVMSIPWRTRIDPDDLKANLDAVRTARERADVVVFSLHEHGNGKWLPPLAHQMIDAGADVFLTHGPHEIHGIEIYHCRPIFYGLGDFVYQAQYVRRVPTESYLSHRLKPDATFEDLTRRRETAGSWSQYKKEKVWEGMGTVVRFAKGKDVEVRLLPVDLGFALPVLERGRPGIADPGLGRKIIGDAAKRSKRFGTAIQYRESENTGRIRFP
jgi:poly-gamma-glutamate capsule biosynthesis protein CapA/YwtB (metallophosphatase superfamily)